MDPNATLAALRKAIEEWRETGDTDLADDLANHAESLDWWLSKGGFLPTDWRR